MAAVGVVAEEEELMIVADPIVSMTMVVAVAQARAAGMKVKKISTTRQR